MASFAVLAQCRCLGHILFYILRCTPLHHANCMQSKQYLTCWDTHLPHNISPHFPIAHWLFQLHFSIYYFKIDGQKVLILMSSTFDHVEYLWHRPDILSLHHTSTSQYSSAFEWYVTCTDKPTWSAIQCSIWTMSSHCMVYYTNKIYYQGSNNDIMITLYNIYQPCSYRCPIVIDTGAYLAAVLIHTHIVYNDPSKSVLSCYYIFISFLQYFNIHIDDICSFDCNLFAIINVKTSQVNSPIPVLLWLLTLPLSYTLTVPVYNNVPQCCPLWTKSKVTHTTCYRPLQRPH